MRRLLQTLFVLSMGVVLNACTDPLKDINVNYIVPTSKAIATLNFVNANKASNNLYPQGLTITYVGSDNYWEPALPTGRTPSWIQDVSGSSAPQPDPASPLKAVALGFNRSITPTPAKPIRFTVIAKAPGFVTTSLAVEIPDTGFFRFDIPMVELASPPQGIGVVTGSTNQGSGGTILPVTLQTSSTTDKPEKARLNIPSGTVMYDAANNVVSGAVNVNVTQFDARNENSLAAFPGGLQPHTALNTNGQPIGPIYFVTAGLLNVKMTSSSKTVKSFSQPVDVTMEVNDALVNPATGQPVQAGDQVPLWSLDDDTGVWTLEDTLAFIRNTTTGKLEARFGITHLSSYNLDWYGERCNQPFVLNVSGDLDVLKAYPIINLKMYDDRTGNLVKTVGVNGNSFALSPKVTFYNGPASGRYHFVAEYMNFFNWQYEKDPGKSTSFQCGETSTYNLQPPPIEPGEVDIRVQLMGTCTENPRIRVYPTTEIWYLKEGEKEWQSAGWMRDGVFKGSAERGATYIVMAFHDGKMHEFRITIPNINTLDYVNTFLMSFKYCSGLR